MLLFAGIASLAIWWRRCTDYDKRLMRLTIPCMLPSALARLPVHFMTNALILGGLDLFVIACVGVDTVRHRGHPAFGWGALAVLAAIHVAFYVTRMPAWIGLGRRLVL